MEFWGQYDLYLMPIALVITIGVVCAIYFPLRKKSDKAKRIPFLVITITLLVMEIVKQIIELIEGYSLFAIPLHICSVFLFAFPVAAFAKPNSKVSKIGYAISLTLGVMVSVGLYVSPSIIIGGGIKNLWIEGFGSSFSNWHTVIYHNLVVVATVLIILFKLYSPKIKDIFWVIGIYGGFLIIAAIMANVLDTNYASFLDFGALNPIKEAAGIFVFDLVWFLICLLVASISGFLAIILPVLLEKRKNKV